jgi:RNA polymerase sigma factor (sigma-70 family)
MDAIEDMIVILYENIHRLKREEVFYSWSRTILVNCCKKLLRKRKRVISLETTPEEGCEGGFRKKEEQLLLEEELSRLAKGHQEVLKLRYYLDLDYQSIADIMKIPLGTVKSRISIALRKLKMGLGGEGV